MQVVSAPPDLKATGQGGPWNVPGPLCSSGHTQVTVSTRHTHQIPGHAQALTRDRSPLRVGKEHPWGWVRSDPAGVGALTTQSRGPSTSRDPAESNQCPARATLPAGDGCRDRHWKRSLCSQGKRSEDCILTCDQISSIKYQAKRGKLKSTHRLPPGKAWKAVRGACRGCVQGGLFQDPLTSKSVTQTRSYNEIKQKTKFILTEPQPRTLP